MAKLSENGQINGQICENGQFFFYGQPVWKMAKFSKFGHKMAKLATLIIIIISNVLNFLAPSWSKTKKIIVKKHKLKFLHIAGDVPLNYGRH